jgi:hypothetical protein
MDEEGFDEEEKKRKKKLKKEETWRTLKVKVEENVEKGDT